MRESRREGDACVEVCVCVYESEDMCVCEREKEEGRYVREGLRVSAHGEDQI